MALELCDGNVKETDIKLTPAHGGRFEIYVNGQKVYDRKEAGTGDFLPSLREVRKAKQALTAAMSAGATA